MTIAAGREARADLDRLRAEIARHGSAVVAFSGGVDSSVVLAVAVEQLGPRALGVTSVSPSVAPDEAAEARRVAGFLGVELRLVETHELDDAAYVANAPDRCFHCKRGLYALCRRVADERGLAALLNGTNADDPGDWRPGLRAAEQAGVQSPLLACGLGKPRVRAVAALLGLPNRDRPATACLASRLPYGTAVTAGRLAAVAAVER
ncbi:MAG TPA: ATP-dependent sacrificial sulfur transferase LarE, partial [Planctomycetota bacterium]|nr:ATP-dependent sacrificial sulfur transferase LarE [Planctomycetota bacterium]